MKNPQYANKLPAYYDSNVPLYLRYHQTRSWEGYRWITCPNYHVFQWNPSAGQEKPDITQCTRCKLECLCKCDTSTLFTKGCQCKGT